MVAIGLVRPWRGARFFGILAGLILLGLGIFIYSVTSEFPLELWLGLGIAVPLLSGRADRRDRGDL